MRRVEVVEAVQKAEVIGILVIAIGGARRGKRVGTWVLGDGRDGSRYLDTDISLGERDYIRRLAVVVAVAVADTLRVVVEVETAGQLQLVVEVIMVV